MLVGGSLRWVLFPLLALVLLTHLTEGKRGGGGGKTSSRGSSKARSSSSSSSKGNDVHASRSSSGSSYSGSRSAWFHTSASSPKSRRGGGFTSNSGTFKWSSAQPRPSVNRDSVSKGVFSSSPAHGYYGTAGCAFGGCGNSYTVYHYYPRSHYYSHKAATTTPSSIGPKSDNVSQVLSTDYDATIVNETKDDNSSQVMEIADPTKPLLIQDLAFFWDNKYLPSESAQGCVSYSPANSNTSISYCDIDEYSRCQRDLKELPGFLSGSMFFPDGTAPSHLAWMCPVDTTCCEWECCNDEGWGLLEVALVMLAVACFVYYIGYKCCWNCFEWCKQGREDKKYAKICEEKQRLSRGASQESDTYSPSSTPPL